MLGNKTVILLQCPHNSSFSSSPQCPHNSSSSSSSTQFLFLLLSTMSTQFLFLLPLSTILPPCLLTTSTCPCVCVCVCRWNGHRNDSAQDPLSQSLPERSSRCSEPSLGELRVSVSISFYCVGTDTGWSRPNHVLHGEH